MKKLTHLDAKGNARMVDVSGKAETDREAVARGSVRMNKETLRLIQGGKISKGDVLAVARVAGIMAAKKTPDLVPMCHPLGISSVSVDFEFDKKGTGINIESRVRTFGRTGVEMEALTAVAAAALAIYDMCKSVDKRMTISEIFLFKKRGGKSGDFRR